MFFLIQTGEPRPSILTANKDVDYHAKWARHCIGQANNTLHTDFVNKTKRNKRFYKGEQWQGDEDLELFLKDDEGQERNRLSLVNNQIRPMIEQYRGNAIRMGINFRVKSVSPQVINRREQELQKVLFITNQASTKSPDGQPNPFASAIRQEYPVGQNIAETYSIFENTYVDKIVKKMNNLCVFVQNKNTFDDKQVRIAEELAFSGIGVMKGYEQAGHQKFRVVQSETFFFDRSAKEYDLSDAAYMGEIIEMSPSEIFETWPDISPTDREAIENFSRFQSSHPFNATNQSFSSNKIATGKVPVYMTYWMDGQSDEYGYVLDKYGYEYLTKINYTYEGEETPRYTDKDLIQSKSIKAKKILGNRLKRRLYCDVVRTAVLIPREILAVSDQNKNATDVVLEHGIAPYQEVDYDDFSTAKFPYKAYCWGYIDGEVLSPIDDAIDPQRFINRIWSVAENQINNAGGAGLLYDASMVDDEGELLRNKNQSKPIGVNAKGRGIQNAVGTYDTTIKQGTMVMFNIIEAMKGSIKQTTGVNEALQGESTGSDQLVGVTQLMIQRGSLMQEPFYNSITMVFKQCFQSICTVGKRIYIDSQRNIAIATGDDGAEIITISKDMSLEDFRVFVKRENPDEILINAGNQMLLQFKQLMMLDDKRIANLWGRSSPDEVAAALREYAKEKEEIQRMSQQKAKQEEASLMQQAQAEQQEQKFAVHDAQAREDIREFNGKKADMDKELLKAVSKIAPQSRPAQDIILKNAKNLQTQNF